MGQIRILRTDDFTGGLNLRADPFQLAENESPDMLNVDVDPRGGVFRRGGTAAFNATRIGSISDGAFRPDMLHPVVNTFPYTNELFIAANYKVYYMFGTFGAGWYDTGINYNSQAKPSFATWAGAQWSKTYIARGVATGECWSFNQVTAEDALDASGTVNGWQDSFSSPTGHHMPSCNLLATHVDRMWAAYTKEDDVDYPNRVRFSHPLYPESWRSMDYIDIVGGGSGITALVPFNGALLVFKERSVHAIYGYDTDTFQVVTLTNSIGVPNAKCVVATERGLFMFSWPDGVFMFDGNGFVDIFEKIRPAITLGTINSAAQYAMSLSYCNNKLWLALPTGTAVLPKVNFVYDPTTKSWTKYTFGSQQLAMSNLCDFSISGSLTYHFGVAPYGATLLQVDKVDKYTDSMTLSSNVSFTSYYVTKWHDADVVSAKKMWRRPDLIVKQPTVDTTLTLQVFHDWEEAQVRRTHAVTISAGAQNALQWHAAATEPDAYAGWGEANWGANAAGAQFKKASNLGLARSVQLKITGEADKPWGVNSISYKYIPRKVR